MALRNPVASLLRLLALFPLALASCTSAPPSAVTTAPAVTANRCVPPPSADRLFLRGAMTTWALREDLAFDYVCDAYLLNVELHGEYPFRITDARFSGGANFGASGNAALSANTPAVLVGSARRGATNLRFAFDGAYTLRLEFPQHGGDPSLTIEAQKPNPLAATPVTDSRALSLSFDSRKLTNKAPFGATPAGGEVAFTLDASAGVDTATLVVARRRLEGPQEVLDYTEIARVPLTRVAGASGAWRGMYRFDRPGVYGYWFLIDAGGDHYVYQNNAEPVYWTRELGTNGRGTVEMRSDRRIRPFRHSVYHADFSVPDWARDIVYYYIFPERFRNGDRRNDRKPGPRTFHDRSVEIHRDWNEKPYKPQSGDGSDDLHGNDFFGGDLDGIRQKLADIADLGANTLYLTPIFSAASNHKYDTADYRNVDAHFGGNAAFARLAAAARRRGMRIVLDTSLNHSGADSIYFDRYAKYPGIGAFDGARIHPESPYAQWYRFDASAGDADRQYHGWAGAQDLPELNKSAASFRDFAYRNRDSVMNLWLDRGAAGWRMDVAPWIPDDFWREWRSAVKAHRADALTVCETQFESSKFLLGDEFDSTMNYVFRDAVEAYANGGDARAIYRNIELLRETYPPQAFFALMNLLSTHDTARALHDFGYRDEHTDPGVIALAKRRLRLAVFFQMVFPGAPTVFYGDEVGVTGGEDPFNRVTYPWPDSGATPDLGLRATFKRLIHLRNANAVLRHGRIDAPAHIDEHVIVLIRNDGKHWAITALNNDAVAHDVQIALPAALRGAAFRDALARAPVRAQRESLRFSIAALDGRVLLTEMR
jgi:glycosidase